MPMENALRPRNAHVGSRPLPAPPLGLDSDTDSFSTDASSSLWSSSSFPATDNSSFSAEYYGHEESAKTPTLHGVWNASSGHGANLNVDQGRLLNGHHHHPQLQQSFGNDARHSKKHHPRDAASTSKSSGYPFFDSEPSARYPHGYAPVHNDGWSVPGPSATTNRTLPSSFVEAQQQRQVSRRGGHQVQDYDSDEDGFDENGEREEEVTETPNAFLSAHQHRNHYHDAASTLNHSSREGDARAPRHDPTSTRIVRFADVRPGGTSTAAEFSAVAQPKMQSNVANMHAHHTRNPTVPMSSQELYNARFINQFDGLLRDTQPGIGDVGANHTWPKQDSARSLAKQTRTTYPNPQSQQEQLYSSAYHLRNASWPSHTSTPYEPSSSGGGSGNNMASSTQRTSHRRPSVSTPYSMTGTGFPPTHSTTMHTKSASTTKSGAVGENTHKKYEVWIPPSQPTQRPPKPKPAPTEIKPPMSKASEAAAKMERERMIASTGAVTRFRATSTSFSKAR